MVTQNGKQLGPFTLNEVNAALAGGELSPDDLAWHEGAPGWIMLGAVDGVVTPRSTRSMPLPPPVRSVLVADELEDVQISSQAFGYAYSVIVAVGIIADLPALVYLLAYAGIYAWEKKQLSDPSLLPSSWWLLLVPAYIYKRAKAFRQPMGSFWTFNALLVLSIFIAVAKDNTLTRGARAPASQPQSGSRPAAAKSQQATMEQAKMMWAVTKRLYFDELVTQIENRMRVGSRWAAGMAEVFEKPYMDPLLKADRLRIFNPDIEKYRVGLERSARDRLANRAELGPVLAEMLKEVENKNYPADDLKQFVSAARELEKEEDATYWTRLIEVLSQQHNLGAAYKIYAEYEQMPFVTKRRMLLSEIKAARAK